MNGGDVNIDGVKGLIRSIPDFPKPGINFKDITPILRDRRAFRYVIRRLASRFRKKKIDVVASAESRGFILGGTLAHELGAGFVPLRKPGKLPWKTLRQEYNLEYGKDAFEVHVDGIKPGERVLIVDDVLATGGTMEAAAKLVESLGGKVVGIALLIELQNLKGIKRIKKYDVFSLLKLKG